MSTIAFTRSNEAQDLHEQARLLAARAELANAQADLARAEARLLEARQRLAQLPHPWRYAIAPITLFVPLHGRGRDGCSRVRIMTPPSPSNEPLPPGSALPGLEALAKVAKELHDRGLSSGEIKAALMTALEMHKAKKHQGKILSKANLGKPGPMPE